MDSNKLETIEVITKPTCGACNTLKTFLEDSVNKSLFSEITFKVLETDISVEDLTTRLGYRPRAVPQVFIDGNHIGGAQQTIKFINNYKAKS